MRVSLLEHRARLELPAQWPAALQPSVLAGIEGPTPALVCDLSTIRDRYQQLVGALTDLHCFYALKCNSSPEVLETIRSLGGGFEVASLGELELLRAVGVDPAEVLYSNTVKPPSHIAAAHAAGLYRFAFDSEGELYKLAKYAPGSSVYVRLRVDDSTSLFPLSRKFGAEAHDSRALLLLARTLGLRPYGLTFHVGSQCTTTGAWRQAVSAAGRVMDRLADDGVELAMLNLGGGFPARYTEPVPAIGQITATLLKALTDLLPYAPEILAAEPGRYLSAESAVMVSTVLGREVRAGENWLYLDVGAYNGMLETHQTVNQWSFPLWTSRTDHATASHLPFTVTGPSCDSSDTMFYGAALPSTIDVDDRVYIGSAGAYTLSYASHFNGFPPPRTLFAGA